VLLLQKRKKSLVPVRYRQGLGLMSAPERLIAGKATGNSRNEPTTRRTRY
jgi:hypothetical protein